MKKQIQIVLIGVVSLALVAGCGAPPPLGFASNEIAKLLLGGTSWGDPEGNYLLEFDHNAKLTKFEVADLPPGLENLRLDGQPFTITIPEGSGIPDEFAGMSFTAKLQNTQTNLNEDGSLQMVFVGTVDTPLVNYITLTIDAQTDDSGGDVVLSGLSGSLTANIPFIGDMDFISNESFTGQIPLVQQ